MLKLLVCIDGKPATEKALHFAAELSKRIEAEIAVITVRTGTHAAEDPPPVGVDFPLAERERLPRGLQILTQAMEHLIDRDVLVATPSIKIRDIPKGHMFVCNAADGTRVPFYESYGHFIEALNREIDEHRYDLLIAAPPQRSRLGRWVTGNTTRKLALDLHTSLLVVRAGGPDSRFLVCADGSPSSRRQFPMLKHLLPAIVPPVDLICIQKPKDNEQTVKAAQACLAHAGEWLASCNKAGHRIVVESGRRAEQIIEAAGRETVIMMGASLRHDVYRLMVGSLPMQVLERSPASVLVVKLPPEAADEAFMKDPLACG